MTMTSEPDHERASDEAAAWLIRLQEEPDDPVVRARFEAWRAAAPAHDAAWAEVAEAFDLIGQAMPAAGPERTTAIGRRKSTAFSRRVFGGVAVGAIAACLALLFLPGLILRLGADHATSAGEWQELRLADGSLVDLAPESAIDVVLTPGRRDVRVLEGQAFFRVTPDGTRPFQVQAGDVRAIVVGTAFDVRFRDGGAAVGVSEGKVRVEYSGSSPGVSKLLQSDDWLRLSRSGQITTGNAAVGQIGAWRQGQLVAHDRPIAEVVDELRPYFNGMIVIASDAVARRRVTGVYELRKPVEALRALSQAYDEISMTRVSPWLVVLSGG